MKTPPRLTVLKKAKAALRDAALACPGAYEEFPWGHSAIKVKGRTFFFLFLDDERLSLSAKLPVSGLTALMLPFAQPTHYGLGKSGWVTANFGARDKVPVDLFFGWVEESYRAIAPKKLAAGLPAPARPVRPKRKSQ